MKHFIAIILTVFAVVLCYSQENIAKDTMQRIATIEHKFEGNQVKFTPNAPELNQIAGAPKAFYTNYWEFGDGTYSKENNPTKTYKKSGEYEVRLWATNNYDTGKTPTSRPKKIKVTNVDERYNEEASMITNFDLQRNREPVPEEEFVVRLVNNLEELINKEGKDSFMAMIAEPLIGAGGVLIPPKDYFPAIQSVLDKYDIPLIDDEVVCGFGRTGNCWGYETFSMKPSSITIAKALSSGYIPISAVIVPEEIFEPIKKASNDVGVFGHGYTYSGHPVACAVALKTIEIYEELNLFSHVVKVTPKFQDRLNKLGSYHFVGEARGIGLIAALEIVKDKETKQNFEPYGKIGKKIAETCQKNGLIVRAIGDVIALCPPLIITETQIDEMFDILESSLTEVEKTL